MKKKKIGYLLIVLLIYILAQKGILIKTYLKINNKKKRVCVINLMNLQNVGNILVKFALYTKLKELGLNPTIITSVSSPTVNITFLNKTTNLIVIKKNFMELKERDYDYIVLNSDQTWGYFDKTYFYDIAFLKFAQNWTIPKFIYGASIGSDRWFYEKKEEKIAKQLLRNFTGISFREKGLIKLAQYHLGVKGVFVLDPTLLIDKIYYLDAIKDYKTNYNFDNNFIFVYQLDENHMIEKVMKESSERFNYTIYMHKLEKNDYIESFLFGIKNSQAVITDSFHGTIFSIIFEKPFLSFLNRIRGKGRFDSLKEVFNLGNRIIDPLSNEFPDINLLLEPLNINKTLFSELKNTSESYLKTHLGIII